MIKNKKDLELYLSEDRKALGEKSSKPSLIGNDVYKFQIALRMKEYYTNCKNHDIRRKFWNFYFYKLSIRLGFDIPINVFGPGLNIHHYGCIVINPNAKIGRNCNIQQGVTIGMNHSIECAEIGDNVFIGTGAKIIGKVKIANGCIIGANAVVVKDFIEENSIIAGVPARVIGFRNGENDK